MTSRTTNIVNGTQLVPVAPIMDMTYAFTPTTIAGAVSDAKSATNQLKLIQTTLPLAALFGGIFFPAVGTALLVVRRRRPPQVPEGPWVDELVEPRERVLV